MNRKRPRQPNRHEAGETLIEVIVTMIIVGTAISALVFGIATSVMATSRHRDQATANSLLRGYAEAIKENAKVSPGTYNACPGTPATLTASYWQPSGWDTPSHEVHCTDDPLLRQVRVTVTTPKGVDQSLDVWVRLRN
jgi:type II secretory pathway pseudopilin PulG